MTRVEATQKAQKLFVAPQEAGVIAPHPLVVTSIYNMMKRRAARPGEPYKNFSISHYALENIDLAVEHTALNKGISGEKFLGRVCLVTSNEWAIQMLEYRMVLTEESELQLLRFSGLIDTADLDSPDTTNAVSKQADYAVDSVPVSSTEANMLENLLLYEQVPEYHFSA